MQDDSYNIEMKEGETFNHIFTWLQDGVDSSPVDLTGGTAIMKIKNSKGAADSIIELSTASLSIILGDTTGTIQLLVPAAATVDLEFEPNADGCLVGYYDLVIILGSNTVRLLEGLVYYNKQV